MTSIKGERYVKVGACGSKAEPVWDDGFQSSIRHIYLCYSENSITSIQVAYFDPNKGTVLSPKHGNALSADFFEEINISSNDLIISVGGCYSSGTWQKPEQLLTALKFVTRSGKTYGPYGMKTSDRTISKSFCFTSISGVRGFHGSANDSSLSSIGIYVQSIAS